MNRGSLQSLTLIVIPLLTSIIVYEKVYELIVSVIGVFVDNAYPFRTGLVGLYPPYLTYSFSYPPLSGLAIYFSSISGNYRLHVAVLAMILLISYMVYGLIIQRASSRLWSLLWMVTPTMLLLSIHTLEAIPSALSLISLIFFVNGFIESSAILLAISSSFSIYSFLLLPAFTMSAERRGRFILTYLLTFLVFNFPMAYSNLSGWMNSYLGQVKLILHDYSALRFIFESSVNVSVISSLLIYVAIYSLLLTYQESRIFNLCLNSLLIFNLSSTFYPLTSIWILPLLSLFRVNPLIYISYDLLNVLWFFTPPQLLPFIVILRQISAITLMSLAWRREVDELKFKELIKPITLINSCIKQSIKALSGRRITPFILWVSALALLAYRCWEPSKIYFDEAHYVPAAKAMLNGSIDPNWIHPPLGKELMALGIALLSDTPVAWRIIGIMLSSLAVPALYLMALKLLNSEKVALISSLFLLFDPLYYAQSRIAMLDVYVFSFSVIAVLFYVYHYFGERSLKTLYISGVFFGLAVSSKLPGVLPLILCLFSNLSEYVLKRDWRRVTHTLVALLLIPSAIFTSTYYPAFFIHGKQLTDFVDRIKFMVTYSAYLPPQTPHPYRSQPWEWPVMTRPLLSLYDQIKVGDKVFVASISDFGSPVTWFGGLIALSTILVDVFDKRRGELVFMVGWFLISWLPYFPMGIQLALGVGGREQFIFYYMQCLPQLFLIFARELNGMDLRFKVSFSTMTLISTLIFYALSYPVISGLPVPIEYISGFKALKLE